MFTAILNIVADEGNVDSVISFLAHTGTSPGVMEKLKPALQQVRERFPGRVFMLCARLPREMADEFFEIGFLTFEDPTRAIAAVAALSRLAKGYTNPPDAPVKVNAAARLLVGPINEEDAKRLRGAAGISFAPEQTALTRDEAV